VSDGVYFVCKFSEIRSLLTLSISALCYCSVWCVTVNVAVRLFQLLPSAECCQFQQTLHAALYSSIYSLLTWSSLGTLQGFLGPFAKFRTVTISFVIYDGTSVH